MSGEFIAGYVVGFCAGLLVVVIWVTIVDMIMKRGDRE